MLLCPVEKTYMSVDIIFPGCEIKKTVYIKVRNSIVRLNRPFKPPC